MVWWAVLLTVGILFFLAFASEMEDKEVEKDKK